MQPHADGGKVLPRMELKLLARLRIPRKAPSLRRIENLNSSVFVRLGKRDRRTWDGWRLPRSAPSGEDLCAVRIRLHRALAPKLLATGKWSAGKINRQVS